MRMTSRVVVGGYTLGARGMYQRRREARPEARSYERRLAWMREGTRERACAVRTLCFEAHVCAQKFFSLFLVSAQGGR